MPLERKILHKPPCLFNFNKYLLLKLFVDTQNKQEHPKFFSTECS